MQTQKVFKIDLLSVRPYLTTKNAILFVVLSSLYAILSKSPILVVSMSQMFAMMFAAYPFMVGEEAGIDPLYRLFNIEAQAVVRGRYLLSVFFVMITLIAGIILGMLMSFFFPTDDLGVVLLALVPLTFIISTLIIFMQYPIFFKYGYAKGKMLTMIPIITVGILMLGSALFKNQLQGMIQVIANHLYVSLGLVLIGWVLISFFSYKLSSKWYADRDF